MEIITAKYYRDFAIDRGRGTEYVRWSAWRGSRPNVKGYGRTEDEAISDLVHFVQPLNTDDDSMSISNDEHLLLTRQSEAPAPRIV